MKKISIVALAVVALFASSFTANANDGTENPVELKVVGKVNELPLYRLSLNNSTNDKYVIVIKDAADNVLYSEKISGVNLTRNYQFSGDIAADENITVEVRSLNTKKDAVYTISKSTKWVDDITVNKVK